MSDHSGFPAPSEEASAAWDLVQLTELLRAAEACSDEVLRTLRNIDTEIPEGGRVARDADVLAHLKGTLNDYAQLAEHAAALAERLPDTGIEVHYKELAGAAAHDLAEGILDPVRVRWAAELLDYRVGWRALAEGLRASDAHGGWGDLTLQDLLTRFRRARVTHVRELTASTDVTPATEFAECTPPQIALLAASLDLAGATK
jgi:hypothetical protein